MPPEVEPPEAEAFCVVVVPPDKPNTLRPRSSRPLLNTLFPRSVIVALAHRPRSVNIAIGHSHRLTGLFRDMIQKMDTAY